MAIEMIKLTVVFLVAVASAARLENNYLPPNGASTAGGNGNVLSTPFSGSNRSGAFGNGGQISSQYSGPVSGSNGDYFNGRNGAVVVGNGAIANSPQLSSEYSAPVKNTNGVSSVYGVPSQNGIQAGEYRNQGAGGYSGRIAAPINILRYNNENNGDGTYRFEYETENHISQQETGELTNAGGDNESNIVRGSYSYAGPDGRTYTVNYIADENGFQPTGEHIHSAIQAAAANAARTSNAEGSGNGYPSRGQHQQPQGGSNGNGGYQY